MPIEPLPLPSLPPVPNRDDPATFEDRYDAAITAEFEVLPPWIEEQVNRAFLNSSEAAEAAADAVAAAASATTAVGAQRWVSGQNYTEGDAVWSPMDFQTYRRRTAGSGTTDPSLDPTNWQQLGGVIQGGSASFSRYDLASGEVTDTLDLAVMQVFRIDASTPRTLAFANEPGTDRAMTVVIHITGNSAVAWPETIIWDEKEAPELGDSFTRVVLFWDGEGWSGFVGVAR